MHVAVRRDAVDALNHAKVRRHAAAAAAHNRVVGCLAHNVNHARHGRATAQHAHIVHRGD
jgi:hypothetical protein